MEFLQKTIEEFLQDIDQYYGERKDHWFLLKRWSKDEPFWCAFLCGKMESGEIGFCGHFGIPKEVNLHSALSLFADSSISVTIEKEYFI